jgi:hypothetical protein
MKYPKRKLSNYQLLKKFNYYDYSGVEVEIIEKTTLKKGFAVLNANKEIELWYGNKDGSDDKMISKKEFNGNFVISNINMLANLSKSTLDKLLKTNK